MKDLGAVMRIHDPLGLFHGPYRGCGHSLHGLYRIALSELTSRNVLIILY